MENDRESFLIKARESLVSAESDFVGGRYNSCANRCYYACYQAAIAALLHEGIRPTRYWGHDYVRGQFVGLVINRRKRYAPSLRPTLIDNLELRHTADYETAPITRTQASRALARARDFVQAIDEGVHA